MVTRRDFLKSLAITVPLVGFGFYRWQADASPPYADPMNDPRVYVPSGEAGEKMAIRGRLRPVLRPPGALAEEPFKRRCIRCHRCGQACPNDTIRFVRRNDSPHGFGTPVLTPREQGCILCFTCTQACPSGALQKIEGDSREAIKGKVKMGVAVVDRTSCLSYNQTVCGACIRACPLRGDALRTVSWEKPIVNAELCVGCGLCEQACLQKPQAIRVVPLEDAV